MPLRNVLVVGGEGLIGHALVDRFHTMKVSFRYTSRRQISKTDNCVHLDLSAPFEIDFTPSTVFICAGATNLLQCEKNPVDTQRINVDATLHLATKLHEGGATIVYLSSAAVFDGSFPHMPINAPLRPTTEYGRQKTEVERGILAFGKRGVVVRMTKIVSSKVPLFSEWFRNLSRGRTIRPFSDLLLSPISLNFLTEVLASDQLSGIIHLSGEDQVTYAEFALQVADKLGVSRRLVKPTTSKEMGVTLVFSPRHTTLDMSHTIEVLGIKPQKLSETVNDLVHEFFHLSSQCESAI